MIAWIALVFAVLAFLGLWVHAALADAAHGGIAHRTNAWPASLLTTTANVTSVDAAMRDVSFVPQPVSTAPART